jgi:signal transduction histidine kinase
MEAGKIEWEMKLLSMDTVVKRAISTTSYFFEQNNLKLIKDIENGLPLIMGDEDRLIQVVINLISNAVKFTEKGSITCRVKNINNEIIVNIIDTGIGISEVDKEIIFEKFKQISDTYTHNQRGTGLGLSICRQIVLYHGGRIWVESVLGKGSNFIFAIPCEKN